MNGIARGKSRVTEDNFLRAFDRRAINRKYLIDDAEQGIECRLNRITAVHCDVTMENFLQNLGVGDQSLSFANEFLDPSLCVNLVRMGCSHKIHWNIGIDQNHDSLLPRYPCSISSRMVSISPVGNSCLAAARTT